MSDRLLTAEDVTRQMQISVPTLYRLMARGEFPRPLKFGSLSRWPEVEVAAAIRAAALRRNEVSEGGADGP